MIAKHKTIFKIIGKAADNANLLLAFNIDEYIEEMLIRIKKGNIIRDVLINCENFSEFSENPGAIKNKKEGIKISTKITINKVDKANINKILPANLFASYFSFSNNSLE